MSDEYLQRRGRDVTLESSAIRLLSAIEKLGELTPEKVTYFEASPLKDAECYKRWYELNSAGKFLRKLLASRKATETVNPNAGRMCPECKAVGGADGVTNCDTCASGFWESSQAIKRSEGSQS